MYSAWRKKIHSFDASDIATDIVELMPSGLFITDKKGIITNTNNLAKELVACEDLIGKSICKYIMDNDKGQNCPILLNSGDLSNEFDKNIKIISNDGRVFPAMISISDYRLPQSTTQGKIIILRDSSRTVNMIKELRDKEQFTNTILDAIQDGISVLDKDLNIIKTNTWLEKLFGSKESLYGSKCYSKFHNRESICPWCPSAWSMHTGEANSAIVPFPFSSEKPDKWLELTAFPIMNQEGEIDGVIEYIKDVTEKKNAEDELKRKTRLLDQVFNGIQEGICLLDADHRIKYHNPALIRLLQSTEEMITGENIIDYVQEKHLMGEYIENPIEKAYEFQLKTIDGSRKFVRLHLSPRYDDDGNYFGAFGSMLDITESRVSEMNLAEYRLYLEKLAITRTEELEETNEKLKQEINERKQTEIFLKEAKEEAERANQVKSQLIFNVSHEMRTPLNCIIGFSEIILGMYDVDDIHPKAETVLQESENLLMLINDLLDHAKIEAGKFELEKQPLDLRQLLASIKNTVSVKCQEKGIDLFIDVDNNLPKYIYGDALRLRQVLINLVGNAIKFTEKGHVKIIIDVVEMSAKKVLLKYSVEDTGIGIPREKQKLIFQSFTQADGSTTRKYGGTGLGTTIARELVEQMGGEMDLESQVGKGSVFFFETLTEIAQEPKLMEEMALSNDDSQIILNDNLKRSGLILLTEDYIPNQEMAKQHLLKVGYQVDIASNGQIALDKCKENVYDLILMDVQMPIMDGYTAIKKIREGNSKNKAIPILAMTANADSTTRKKCLATGVNDVVTKPIRRKSFISIVDKWINPGSEDLKKSKKLPNIEDEKDDNNNNGNVLPIDISVPLEEFGSMEDVKMILSHFMQSVEEQKANIKSAMEAGDNEKLRREFHSIKGAALTIEALPLSKVARKLENLAKEAKTNEIPKLMYDLSHEIERLKNYLEENVFDKAA
ncbi:MAG: ATP-binding protein [Candidatus Zixiibacteriota bacterium]